jgi:hypothetical protein
MAIQMSDCLLESEQCFLQSQIQIKVKIVANSFENTVWLLADHKYNISLYHIRYLLTLSFEQNCVSIRHSPLHIHQELFTLLN